MSISTTVDLSEIDLNRYNRYIEVALGAGMGLKLFNPQIPYILNDTNTDLINFYKNINDPNLQLELKAFANNWELIGEFSEFSNNEILMAFQDYSKGIISAEDIEYIIRAIILMNMNHEDFHPLFEKKFSVSVDMFSNAIIKKIVSALLKLKGDLNIEALQSDTKLFSQNIEIACRSGLYEHVKSLVNWQKTNLIDCITLTKHLASWFFLKELGKGHQLQYDNNGNLKNHYSAFDNEVVYFNKKVAEISDSNFLQKIKKAKLYNLNPTNLIEDIKATTDDFILANLLDSNIVLAHGKNNSGINSQIEMIKQLIKYDLNLIILINNESVALEFKELSGSRFNVFKIDNHFCVSNIDL